MPLFTNDPPRTLRQRIFYRSVQWIKLCIVKIFFNYKYRHTDRLPLTGAALICPNHFSHLDPMAVGCIAPRRVSFLAKKALWNNKWIGRGLDGLDCIQIDREATGIGGMKATLKRLKKGESVVLFPEGERSFDGNLLPLMTGFTALVKRVKIPIVPIGIYGTHEAWARGVSKPKMGRVRVYIGHPIPYSDLENMSEQEMADFVGKKIAECYEEAKLF